MIAAKQERAWRKIGIMMAFMSKPNALVLCIVVFSGALLAQKPKPAELLPAFELEVTMSPSLSKDLPVDQIKNDMELILRRNGIGIASGNGQILKLTVNAVLSQDKQQMAADVKLDLLMIGFALGPAMSCSGKPSEDKCWEKAARRIGYWNDDRVLIAGPNWPLEFRQTIKDLTDTFALFYLRLTQESTK